MAGKIKKSLRKKKKNLKMIKEEKEEKAHSYNINHTNWSQRGSACFNEIKRVGISFIDELLRNRLVNEDLNVFGSSLSSAIDNIKEPSNVMLSKIGLAKSRYPEGTKEFAEDLWNIMCNIIKSSSVLVPFQYSMENEKWIEIKRIFNIFQIDGETLPDITLKIVLRQKDNKYVLEYYIRCLGNLVKTGILASYFDVVNLIKILGRSKHICIGLDKDEFIYQVDENEKIRQYIKEYALLSFVPFESLRHIDCKSIVRDSLDSENYKFQRGEKTICGPLVICRNCEDLYAKLENLVDHTLNTEREDYFKPPKYRYGPVECLKVSKKIKKLCTETAFEFVKDSQKNMDSFRKLGIETDVLPRDSELFTNLNSSEDERPSVTVSEQEFEKMFSLRNTSSNKIDKICDKCNYVTDSMLELFIHMSNHIVSSDKKECDDLFSSNDDSLEQEKTVLCERDIGSSVCQSATTNQNSSAKLYLCVYCDMRMETLDQYKKHMKNIHQMNSIQDMNFGCPTCQIYFYTRNHLLIHQLNFNHLNKTGVKCYECGCIFSSVAFFQSHIQSSQHRNEDLVMCFDCRKFFFSNFELEEHRKNKPCNTKRKQDADQPSKNQSNKNVKIFTCTCNKCCKNCNAGQKHVECCQSSQVANNNETTDSETITGGASASIATSGAALSTSSIYSISCNVCGLKCSSEYYLNVHMNLQHPNSRTVFHFTEQQQLHQQAQSLPTYKQVYNQQPTFSGDQGQVTQSMTHSLTQSDIMEVSSPEIDWSKQTISNIEEHSDTVYSLLHL